MKLKVVLEPSEEGGLQHNLILVIDRHLQHEDINRFAEQNTERFSAADTEVLRGWRR